MSNWQRKQSREEYENESYQNKRFKDGRGDHKIMSSIGAVHNDSNNNRPRKRDIDFTETSKPTISEAYTKPDTLNRNKRMFGLMMGHLGMARQKLEADSNLIKKQTEISVAVAERNAKEVQRVELLKKQERRKQIYENKVNTIKSSFNLWKTHTESLVHFLFTDCEPKLTWLPANHNKQSRDLLKNRNEEVSRLIAEREVEDEKKLKLLEEQNTLAEEAEEGGAEDVNNHVEDQAATNATEEEETHHAEDQDQEEQDQEPRHEEDEDQQVVEEIQQEYEEIEQPEVIMQEQQPSEEVAIIHQEEVTEQPTTQEGEQDMQVMEEEEKEDQQQQAKEVAQVQSVTEELPTHSMESVEQSLETIVEVPTEVKEGDEKANINEEENVPKNSSDDVIAIEQ